MAVMGTDIETIYIVDDDPAVREALSSLLTKGARLVAKTAKVRLL